MTPSHAYLVHLPLALAVVSPFFALGVASAIWRRALPEGAWSMVLVLQLLVTASGFLAVQSGEREEERVEALVPHEALEEHEERAERFARWNLLVLALVILPVFRLGGRPGLRRGLSFASAGAMGASLFLAVTTGEAGGALVYEHGAARAYSGAHAAEGEGAAGQTTTGSGRSRGYAAPSSHGDDDHDD